jgi:hypothetical protein
MKILVASVIILALGLATTLAIALQYRSTVMELRGQLAGEHANFLRVEAASRSLLETTGKQSATIEGLLTTEEKANAALSHAADVISRLKDALKEQIQVSKERVEIQSTNRIGPRQLSRPAPDESISVPSGPSLDAVRATAVSRAENYFRFERMGASPTIAIDVKIETEAPVEIPGWTGEYHVRGIGHLSYFDSRGLFNNDTEKFEVRVKMAGSAAWASDFSLVH